MPVVSTYFTGLIMTVSDARDPFEVTQLSQEVVNLLEKTCLSSANKLTAVRRGTSSQLYGLMYAYHMQSLPSSGGPTWIHQV